MIKVVVVAVVVVLKRLPEKIAVVVVLKRLPEKIAVVVVLKKDEVK